MKRLYKILRVVALVLVVAILAGAVGGYLYARRAWPRSSGALTLRALGGEVEISRDAYGVPHIFAKQEHDVFFGQGYAHAQDRLWQMHLARSLARGELSEMFGEAAIDSDRITRTLGLSRAAARALPLLDADTRQIVQSYCDGVNAFLDGDPTLPVEFAMLGTRPHRWEPLDVLLVGENISMAMSLNYYFELMRVRLAAKVGPERATELIPPYPADAPITIPAPEKHGAATPPPSQRLMMAVGVRPGGSNSWAVHGSRTATGKPMLANDTHLGLPLPSLWYENGLYAGRYSVVGFSFPGAPLVALGHNQRIAWGITNMCSDVQDVYLEKVEGDKYQYQGNWYPLQIVNESVPAKGRAPIPLRIASTRHGPLINEAFAAVGGKDVPTASMRWAAREGGTLFPALAALDRAQSYAEFHEALRSWQSPSLNFVYADVDGNIGYQATGRIPIRAKGHEGTVPVAGWTGESEWQGFIPYDELPSAKNPPAGYVVSANNKVVPDSYPHHLAYDMGDPYRATRITQLLKSNPRVTFADMRAMQGDTYSLPAEALRPHLLQLRPVDELEKRALELVKAWDLRFDPDSAAASVYYLWYANLLEDIIGDEVGPALMKEFRSIAMTQTPWFVRLMNGGKSPWFDDVTTPEKETRDQISARAFQKGVAFLKEKLGGDPAKWRWGRLHTMTFNHQPFGESGIAALEKLFNSRTVESSGEPYSINATFHDPGVTFAVGSGPAQRFVADLSALERSVSSTPVGQSGLLFHPHREDQVELWRRVDHHPMLFEREAVTRAAAETLMLRPATPSSATGSVRNP